MKKMVIITLIGIIAGGIAGLLYWKNFGCHGNCMITSKPFNSSIYGALLGGLFFNTVASFLKK